MAFPARKCSETPVVYAGRRLQKGVAGWGVNIFLRIKRSPKREFSILAVYGTFQNQGQALVKYGVAVLFSLLFGLAGLVLGILSRMEQDRFYVFSYIGIGLNLLTIVSISFILYAGVYGL